MLVWPILHLALGNLGTKTGGNFWIHSNGIQDTLVNFLQATVVVPVIVMTQRLAMPNQVAWLVWVVMLSVIAVWSMVLAKGMSQREMRALLIRIASCVGIVAVIDRHTPISTARNFIVLLPAVALLFGHAVEVLWVTYARRWQRVMQGLILMAFLAASALHAWRQMEDRWMPGWNWRGLAEIVQSAGTCRPHCWFAGENYLVGLYSYYFKTSMGPAPEQTTLSIETLLKLQDQDRLPIIAAKFEPTELARLRKFYAGWLCLEPPQSRRNSVVLLVPSTNAPKGLRPCQQSE